MLGLNKTFKKAFQDPNETEPPRLQPTKTPSGLHNAGPYIAFNNYLHLAYWAEPLFFVIAQWFGMQHAYLLHQRGERGHERKRREPWTQRRVTAQIWVNYYGLAEGLGPAERSVDRSILGRLYHADAEIIKTLTMIIRAWEVNMRWIQINLTASPLVWHGKVWKISGRSNIRSKPPTFSL